MNRATKIATAQLLLEAMETNDFATWQAALSPEFRADYPGAATLDADAACAYSKAFPDAFPDLHFELQSATTEGNTVVLCAKGVGTFTKPLATPHGLVPPTGRAAQVSFTLVTTLGEGKIVQERTFWDRLDFFQQLGLA